MRALTFLVLASCTHDVVLVDRVDVQQGRDLDLLFVFDNSNDRGNYDQMAWQLDDLRARLTEIDGQLPNLHVGVVTTDLGTSGTEDAVPAPSVGNCIGGGDGGSLVTFTAGVDGNFLEDLRGPDGTRVQNFGSGDLVGELRKLTNPLNGTENAGCSFEQPLEAMRRALDPAVNQDFIRPDAMLSVVFLTTDDDCSLKKGAMLDPLDGSLGPLTPFRCTEQGVICDGDDPRRPGVKTNCRPREGSPFMVDVSEYQAFLQSYKPDPKTVTVSAVVGARDPFEVRTIGVPTLTPSCQGLGGAARPAVRLGALVDAFGGSLVDACSFDLAYQKIAAPIVAPQRTCFPNLLRSDGDDCTVIESAADATTELPRCADGMTTACWSIYTDEAMCPGGDNVGIAIQRGATTAPAASRIQATCLVK